MNGQKMHISMVEETGPGDKWAFAWNTIVSHLACSPWRPDGCLSLHQFHLGVVSAWSGLQHCECGYIRLHNSHVDVRTDLYQLRV